ncbi:MAG: hypothetical protein ACO3JT_09025 [Candidatus Nanopelagicales bacterium]
MKIALALTAAVALAATGFVAVPAAAAPEQPRNKKSFSLTGEFTGRQIKPSGNPNGIGDFTVTTGKVSGTEGNGTLTTVIRVVAPGKKSDAELRDTQSQVQLKGGQIFAQAVNEDPKGKPPETLHIMPIVGGTGAYAGARGTLNLIPQGKSGKYLMMYDVFVDKNLRKSTFTFPAPVTERVGTGVGSVILKRAAQDDVSYISVATGLGSAKGSGSRQSIDLQIFDGESTIFARTIAPMTSRKPQSYAILGGTGDYNGARGEIIVSADGRSIETRVALPGGKGKPLSWNNVAKSTVDDSTATGTTSYSSGPTTPARGKQPKGDFFSSALAYPEIDGVTPVITMFEQGFTSGTMVITGMTLAGTPGRLAIIGGTGEYGGAAGSVGLSSTRPGTTRLAATFWR